MLFQIISDMNRGGDLFELERLLHKSIETYKANFREQVTKYHQEIREKLKRDIATKYDSFYEREEPLNKSGSPTTANRRMVPKRISLFRNSSHNQPNSRRSTHNRLTTTKTPTLSQMSTFRRTTTDSPSLRDVNSTIRTPKLFRR